MKKKQYRIKIKNWSFLIFMATLFYSCSEELVLCPDVNHPHAIDLGLPSGTKWACCNVGSPLPEQPGGYYAWGETNVKSTYESNNYQGPKSLGDISGTEYDAAFVNWGNMWLMPDYEQISELLNYCKTQEGCTYNGVKGFMFTGPSGNSIFLPFAGFMSHEEIKADFQGYVWSSTKLNEPHSVIPQAELLKFNKKNSFHEIAPIEWGHNIRPVLK